MGVLIKQFIIFYLKKHFIMKQFSVLIIALVGFAFLANHSYLMANNKIVTQTINVKKAYATVEKVTPKGALYSMHLVVEDNGTLPNELVVDGQKFVKKETVGETEAGIAGVVFSTFSLQKTRQPGLVVGQFTLIELSSNKIVSIDNSNTRTPNICPNGVECANNDQDCFCKVTVKVRW